MSDTIFVNGLVLHAYHGVMPHEAKVGQTFMIDLALDIDLKAAARSDKVADTVSYDQVVDAASKAFCAERFKLIEAAAELFNFFLLMWLLKRKKFDGQVFATFIMLYGVERFFIEFLRDDPGRGVVFGGLMIGTQLISIFLVIGGGLVWWLRNGKVVPTPAESHG